jgi:hypothetical protein
MDEPHIGGSNNLSANGDIEEGQLIFNKKLSYK